VKIMAKRTQHVRKSTGKSKTKMRVYTTREARRIAVKNGWQLVRTAGDHFYYKHPNHSKILTISDGLNRIVWERCVKEFNLNLNV
jgi:predicted RNA binding protein YcfA (HicA-like mRNA interferase family)